MSKHSWGDTTRTNTNTESQCRGSVNLGVDIAAIKMSVTPGKANMEMVTSEAGPGKIKTSSSYGMECHFVISLLLKNIFKGNDISANALDWITVIVSKRKSFTEPQRHVYNWAELNIERFLLAVTLTVDTWHRQAWENPQTVRSFTGSSYGQQRCEVAGNNFVSITRSFCLKREQKQDWFS